MGKKGSWFSAIKSVFTHHSSKEKPSNASLFQRSDRKSSKEKKKGKGVLRHGETKAFIPLFREPSSIEEILGEADQLLIRPPTPPEQPRTQRSLPLRPTSPLVASPKAISHRAASHGAVTPGASSTRITSRKAHSPRASSPCVVSPEINRPRAFTPQTAAYRTASTKATQCRREIRYKPRLEPTLRNQHLSATKIQAAYRGYLARRSFRALRGLVRLQGVVRGQNIKQQTMNAMKQMQQLVRIQTQIHSRRIQMLENQALQRQAYKKYKDVESTLSKLTSNHMSEAGNYKDWDDSLLTKEEIGARLQKKVEAVMKRERAMAYTHSYQLCKANMKSAQRPQGVQSNGFPLLWDWVERQLPHPTAFHTQAAGRNISLTPPRPVWDDKPNPRLDVRNNMHSNFTFEMHEAATLQSSRSIMPSRAKQYQTPSRTPPSARSSSVNKNSKLGANYDLQLRDDDSLTSCPPFSAPHYLTPTVSAKAKVRPNSNPKERYPGTPGNDSKRIFSFPLTPNIGSFKLNKGSKQNSVHEKMSAKHRSSHSIGDSSVDSAISMPATVGRKPFNRFV